MPVDLNEEMRGMQDMLKRSLGELVQIDMVHSPDIWCVEIDPSQLEASILNLAVNARDAMPEGGRLTIEMDNIHLDKDYAAQHPDVPPGQYAMVRVRDSGQGMPPEVMARVFEPFFTTKEVGRGTGLGLSMVYGFAKQSGGHVLLDSTEGSGTTITLLFPRSASTLPSVRPADAQALDAFEVEAETTVLVAEDNDDVRAYTVDTLRQLGYRVLEAHDGPSALRLLDRTDVSVDLLFSDIVMPGQLDGIGLHVRLGPGQAGTGPQARPAGAVHLGLSARYRRKRHRWPHHRPVGQALHPQRSGALHPHGPVG